MDSLKKLSDKVWKTKNARFVASRRMKRSRYSSNIVANLMSVIIIILNMLAFLPKYKPLSAEIAILTICLSIFVLVITLLINQLDYAGREHNYHSCGMELDQLNQQLCLLIDEKVELMLEGKRKYWDQYYEILQKYNLNHTEFDYEYALQKQDGRISIDMWIRWYIFDSYVGYYLGLVILVGVSLGVIC